MLYFMYMQEGGTHIPEESAKPAEHIAPGIFHTQYYDLAISLAHEKAPQAEGHIKSLLDDIDEVASNNLKTFDVPSHEGVVIPYTEIPITKLATDHFLESGYTDVEPTPDNPRRVLTYVVFPGVGIPPGGSPFIAGDMVYDRAIRAISQVVGPARRGEPLPDIKVVSVGSPNGPGGNVTQEWVDSLSRDDDY
jgi:hypothetical protein